MTMAISKAAEEGALFTICASTGNTSASASAYAARAGMVSVVLIPKGKIAKGKLAQAVMHGAVVIQVDGNFDDCLRLVREVAESRPVAVVNSINPYRIQGQKTGAFEICDQLGFVPDFHALPVGNAGNITAYWKGYSEYFERGGIASRPTMLGFQAAGSAPIVLGHPVEKPETIATAIRIGNPASWETAVAAREESGGLIETVTDEEITAAQILLARTEGVFPRAGIGGECGGHHQTREARLLLPRSHRRVHPDGPRAERPRTSNRDHRSTPAGRAIPSGSARYPRSGAGKAQHGHRVARSGAERVQDNAQTQQHSFRAGADEAVRPADRGKAEGRRT